MAVEGGGAYRNRLVRRQALAQNKTRKQRKPVRGPVNNPRASEGPSINRGVSTPSRPAPEFRNIDRTSIMPSVYGGLTSPNKQDQDMIADFSTAITSSIAKELGDVVRNDTLKTINQSTGLSGMVSQKITEFMFPKYDKEAADMTREEREQASYGLIENIPIVGDALSIQRGVEEGAANPSPSGIARAGAEIALSIGNPIGGAGSIKRTLKQTYEDSNNYFENIFNQQDEEIDDFTEVVDDTEQFDKDILNDPAIKAQEDVNTVVDLNAALSDFEASGKPLKLSPNQMRALVWRLENPEDVERFLELQKEVTPNSLFEEFSSKIEDINIPDDKEIFVKARTPENVAAQATQYATTSASGNKALNQFKNALYGYMSAKKIPAEKQSEYYKELQLILEGNKQGIRDNVSTLSSPNTNTEFSLYYKNENDKEVYLNDHMDHLIPKGPLSKRAIQLLDSHGIDTALRYIEGMNSHWNFAATNHVANRLKQDFLAKSFNEVSRFVGGRKGWSKADAFAFERDPYYAQKLADAYTKWEENVIDMGLDPEKEWKLLQKLGKA